MMWLIKSVKDTLSSTECFLCLSVSWNDHSSSGFYILQTEIDCEKCHISPRRLSIGLQTFFRHDSLHSYLVRSINGVSCPSVQGQDTEAFPGLHCCRPGLECLPNASRENVLIIFIIVFQFTLYPFSPVPWRSTAVLMPFVEMLNLKHIHIWRAGVGIWIHRPIIQITQSRHLQSCLSCLGVSMLVLDLHQSCLFLCSYCISWGL